jgi:hypothetical protein
METLDLIEKLRTPEANPQAVFGGNDLGDGVDVVVFPIREPKVDIDRKAERDQD